MIKCHATRVHFQTSVQVMYYMNRGPFKLVSPYGSIGNYEGHVDGVTVLDNEDGTCDLLLTVQGNFERWNQVPKSGLSFENLQTYEAYAQEIMEERVNYQLSVDLARVS